MPPNTMATPTTSNTRSNMVVMGCAHRRAAYGETLVPILAVS